MHEANYLKEFGLSLRQGKVLRALFHAASSGKPLPRSVFDSAHRAALLELVRAGLVSKQGRLTFPGLAVAASLPESKRSRWLDAA